jgi:hypothetical protein
MKKILPFIFGVLGAGCGTTFAPIGPDGVQGLNMMGFSCSQPYALDQHCVPLIGPDYYIRLAERNLIRMSATKDGQVIAFVAIHPLAAGHQYDPGRYAARALIEIEEKLTSAGVKVLRNRLIGTKNVTDGYVIELDKDGYSVLRKTYERIVSQHTR